jgi:glycosyltransferase involved in cell wall biosynthesis
MTAEEPLVSVVICVYNAGEYLRPSLSSILQQTYRNLDILIVDDGSTDDGFRSVEDLIADNRVRVFHQTNATKPVAMNRALDNARGEFYAVHDADDISHPRRIELQLAALLRYPNLAAIYCGDELILNGRRVAPVFSAKSEVECKRAINAFRMPAHDPTGVYRLSLIGDLRYEASLPIVEGFDYVLRVGERHPIAVLGECLYSYRVHSNSVTKRNPARREQLVGEVLNRACDRRGLDFARVFPHGRAAARRSRNSVMDNNIAAHFIESVVDQRRAGHRLGAVQTGLECVRLHPIDPHYHKAMIYALAPLWVVEKIRRSRGTEDDTICNALG